MEPAKTIKAKLARGELVAGVLATSHLWPGLVEVAIDAGLDYIIIDLEHGAHGDNLVAEVCTLGRTLQFAVFVRPARNDFRTVSKTMDLGPCGLLLATVESEEAMDVVRDAIYLPPRGRRRPGGAGNRWVQDFHYASWKQQVEEHVIVVPQIETLQGLEHVSRIAAHEITTGIGLGPYDLSMSLGTDMDWDHPDFVSALKKIEQVGQDVGKPVWRIGDVARLSHSGSNFVCIGDPTALMATKLRETVEAIKG